MASVWTTKVDFENRDYNLINQDFTESELEAYIADNEGLMTKIRWQDMAQYQNLTENFMKNWIDKLPIAQMATYQPMSEEMIDYLLNYIQYLEDTTEPRKTMYTDIILQHQDVSEALMTKYKDMIQWISASTYSNMSYDYIKEMKYYVNWEAICKFKTLTKDFMLEMMDFLHYRNAFFYQETDDELDAIFKSKINTYDDYFQAFWVRKNYIRDRDASYWRELIKSYKTYPTNYSDDYFIGYKAIRSDGYSIFTFRDRYEAENVYEAKSDYNDVESSFGLGIYNRDKAFQYGMQKDKKRFDIVALKVMYEDVTFVSENYVFPKVRASKIQILSEDPEYYRYDD